MARSERNTFTEENYQLLINYTRNKTFKFKTREDIIDELKSIGVLKATDSASVATVLLGRLVDHGVMRMEYYLHAGDSNKYKFTGCETKWHLNATSKKESFLVYDSGPTAELGFMLNQAWYDAGT